MAFLLRWWIHRFIKINLHTKKKRTTKPTRSVYVDICQEHLHNLLCFCQKHILKYLLTHRTQNAVCVCSRSLHNRIIRQNRMTDMAITNSVDVSLLSNERYDLIIMLHERIQLIHFSPLSLHFSFTWNRIVDLCHLHSVVKSTVRQLAVTEIMNNNQ